MVSGAGRSVTVRSASALRRRSTIDAGSSRAASLAHACASDDAGFSWPKGQQLAPRSEDLSAAPGPRVHEPGVRVRSHEGSPSVWPAGTDDEYVNVIGHRLPLMGQGV